MKLYRSTSGIFLVVLVAALAACGGGDTATQSVWQTALRSDSAPERLFASLNATINQPKSLDATTLFDWAESRYPELFPKGPVNQTEGPYLYRYYPANKLYLGARGDEVLWLGPNTDNKIVSLGR